jgi:prepilin-type N-terminal cleavage/methylation domain-containing protein
MMRQNTNLKIKKKGFIHTSLFKVRNKSSAGFTLFEILVAISVFSIIIGSISGILVFSIREQRKILTYQTISDQTSYALEYMSRTLRMARKQLPPNDECSATCLSQTGLNYELFNGDQELRFQNYDCVCQRFFIQNGQLIEQKSWQLQEGDVVDLTGNNPPTPLTSVDIEVSRLKFDLSGQNQIDNLQPRITFYLEIGGGKVGLFGSLSKIKIQSTVSQRMLDVVY